MSIIRTAPAPTRATSSVTLSAGLINIPLSVFTAVETTSVTRREFLNGNPDIPVGRSPIRKDDGTIIFQGDVVRMAEASNGTWVPLDDDEIAGVAGTPGGCEVVSFVPVKDTGHYLTDGLYQVRPKNDKRGGAAATAAFGLLLAGMAARKVHALVRLTMRGTPRYGLLTTDGDLFMIATADGIREALPLPTVKPAKAELAMVCSLIDAIGIETPTVVDDTAPKVQAFVDSKAGPGNVTAIKSAAPAALPVDLTEMLEASIKAAKAKKVAA
jgi:non-homologous end joining protein Ku